VDPFHYGMARPRVVTGEDSLQIRKVAANILNKQSRTADKGWYSSLGLGEGAKNSPQKKTACYEMLYRDSELESGSGYGPATGSSEHGNELPGSIKSGQFLD
jgi:hypothetical protein